MGIVKCTDTYDTYTNILRVNGETVYSSRTTSKNCEFPYMNSCFGLGYGYNCGWNPAMTWNSGFNYCNPAMNCAPFFIGGSFGDGFATGLGVTLGGGAACGFMKFMSNLFC